MARLKREKHLTRAVQGEGRAAAILCGMGGVEWGCNGKSVEQNMFVQLVGKKRWPFDGGLPALAACGKTMQERTRERSNAQV